MVSKASGHLDQIAKSLIEAALTRQFTSDEAWDHGWCVADYRRSAGAAVSHDTSRRVNLSAEGVAAFEGAMHQLFKLAEVRDLYDAEELWGVVAGIIGALPMPSTEAVLEGQLNDHLKRLATPPDSVVVVPIANLNPGQTLIEAGPLLIGRLGDEWRRRLKERAGEHEALSDSRQPWWQALTDDSTEQDVVLLAHFGRSQLDRAFRDTEETFENLVALALVLESDLDGRRLYSLRGDSHRPGIRGLAVDRLSLRTIAVTSPKLFRDLAAEVLVSGISGTNVRQKWYGEDPFPLHELLEAERLAEARRLLTGRASVHNRLRLAARWHAKAYWSSEVEDAVLALGIGFEALLSEGNPSPGRVLGERFAFLAPLPSDRPARYKLFTHEYYAARSSIAHGAKRTNIDGKFARRMAKDLRQTFLRIASLTSAQSVESEDAYGRLFDTLKWGI
jgi:hypothetical protein